MKNKEYKTIVMSDIHLGSKWSKAKEANLFLKQHTCETLILCGDIIDGWEIVRGKKPKWKKRHTYFIKRLLSILPHTRIIYLRGNHDDFLDRILPLEIPNLTICRDYVYRSGEQLLCPAWRYIRHDYDPFQLVGQDRRRRVQPADGNKSYL